MEKPKVIIVSESTKQSVLRDLFTFVMLAGLIGLGWWIESDAMQWIGGLIGLFFVIVKGAATLAAHHKPMTIAEARAKLDEMEADQ